MLNKVICILFVLYKTNAMNLIDEHATLFPHDFQTAVTPKAQYAV